MAHNLNKTLDKNNGLLRAVCILSGFLTFVIVLGNVDRVVHALF